ncbi:hypothetical protein [Oligoflexus tunisiensis]|uniref:hypothetical protein n=1 Tax=Oligoflexus tunisiensis TaxID=708132 RepID=UPI00114D3959|nr:hypothetical protein [Oligoflexus tunisiensis]
MKLFAALFAVATLATQPLAAQSSGRPTQMVIQAGIDEGGLALGGDFLVNDTATESYGGYLRLYSKDEDKGAPAIFALGASGRGHVKVGIFEYYLSPGFGLIHYNLDETELLFGPTLTYGLTADIDPYIGLGVENTKLYSWMGEHKGLIKDTFLAHVRFRL